MHEASWPWVKWLRPSWSRKTFCQLADLSALISRPPVLSPLVSPCLVASLIAICRPLPKSLSSCRLLSRDLPVSSCLLLSWLLLLSPPVSSGLVRPGDGLCLPCLLLSRFGWSCHLLSGMLLSRFRWARLLLGLGPIWRRVGAKLPPSWP